ncbi:MAG: ribonuclease III [Flavobacteriales bacterium]|nr:ribonuclease III [Flavobacteriales bacterium]
MLSLKSFFSKKKTDTFSQKIHQVIGFKPKNIELYKEALTHKSFYRNKSYSANYERLEFLGDSVLGCIVSEYLFHSAPNQQEGYLTQMRSKLVSRKKLNKISKELHLIDLIRKDKESSLGENIHGNILESLIGAIYLDYGTKECKNFIHKNILNKENLENLENQISSYKGMIIEHSQKHKINISFETSEEKNAQNHTVFVSILKLNGNKISKGRELSKKKAEEIAAKRAFYSLKIPQND